MRRLFTLLATAGALGAGCGNAVPPVFTGGSDTSSDGGASSGDGAVPLLAVDAAPPSCEAGTNGDVCGCLDLSLLANPPNLYFVLDRSGSMQDDGKWTTIRTVIADVMHRIGPRARFGAAIFPSPAADADECAAGVQVMPMTLGDAPAGTYGPTTGLFTAATNYPPTGGTPTAATMTALTSTLTALPGKTFVILATDGGPNCDPGIMCDSSACTLNIDSNSACSPDGGTNCCAAAGYEIDCLDGSATDTAISTLAKAGVPTYVVGVPGSGPYGAVLDGMALAGGTARTTTPYYYPVDSTDTDDFTATLSTVAAQITATCTLTLASAPTDPNLVNVYLDGVVVPENPTNGWTISGATITLQGTTCTSVLAGDALDLRIVAGCPTVSQ